MASGLNSWTFRESDFNALTYSMQRFVDDSGCHCALLVDRSGQLITTVGEKPDFDTTAFASLTAADYSANDQLARLIGENDFSSLFHQGERESMYLAGIMGRLILVALFDNRTTLGLVRLRTRQEVEELSRICERMFADSNGGAPPAPGILAGADDEIDQLFK
jgi:predicted regulator of Ras-like GTPase activity (Roadblock/LC7/MglB family)